MATESEWADWVLERYHKDRIVKREAFDGVMVETSFMTVRRKIDGEKMMWQSQVSGGAMGGTEVFCKGSREQAEAMHEQTVEAVKETMKKHKV